MSSDEDTELRDLVAQTLESNGVLGKIRAQLRASVFLALEEHEGKQPFSNPELKRFLSTKEGQAVAGLVREFLEFFNLEYTLAVFEPEAGLGPDNGSRASIARELNIKDTDNPPKGPLLCDVVNRSKSEELQRSKSNPSETSDRDALTSIPKDLTSKQVADARQKFEFYDKDRNGEIDKDELRALFVDMFPDFNRNMLDRYVNDEFRAVDTDLSNSIDFNEFLGMYRRLFLLCRSVVSGDVDDILSSQSLSLKKGNGFVDSKNQRNLQGSPATNGPKHSKEVDLLGSDIDEDPFFDDPVPSGKGYGNMIESPRDTRRGTSGRPSQIPVYSPMRSANSSVSSESGRDAKPSVNGSTTTKQGGGSGGGMTSLSGLPTLNKPKGPKEDSAENLRAVDRGMADLGLDGDFDYDDDFLPSSTHSASNKVSKSEQRSEQNGSIAEEIEEEDIDTVSIEADDLLKSEKSGYDDLTTDRTISQQDGYDYMEDIQSP